MSEKLSEKEERLEHELEEAQQELTRVQAEYERIESECERLRRRRSAAQILDTVRGELAELSQLEPPEEVSPFTGEPIDDPQQRNQHYTAFVERIKSQVDTFRKALTEVETRLEQAGAEVDRVRKNVEAISAQLELSRPVVRTRTVTRVDEEGVEHAYLVVYRRDALMPWSESEKDQRRFKKVLVRTMVMTLLLMLIMPWIPVPEIERSETVEIPDRVAQLREERKPPPPPPPPPPKRGDEKAEQEPEEQKELEPREKAPEPETEVAKAAREKASRSGLLAFSDDFSDLMDNPAEEKLGKQARVTSEGEKARRTERSMVTAAAGQGSGGIETANLSRDVAGSGLEGRGTSRVTGTIGSEMGDAQKPLSDSEKGSRSDEEIQIVFDRNKSALYRIYQRALRTNPSLQGKVVLKVTIAPSGEVTASSIESSDLDAPDLEKKIAARVKMFKFKEKDVPTITITYPIDFLPA